MFSYPGTAGDPDVLEKLIHDIEFENQQYVKQIEKEKQLITAFEKQVDDHMSETCRLQQAVSQLDEDTKRYHRQFTQNRDNIESLKQTSSVLSEHVTAMRKKHLDLVQNGETERKERSQVLDHYKKIWESYKTTYESFELAKKYYSEYEAYKEAEKLHREASTKVKKLRESLSRLQAKKGNDGFIPFAKVNDLMIKLSEIKVSTNKCANQIEEYGTEASTMVKQIQGAIKKKIEEKKNRQEICRQEELRRKNNVFEAEQQKLEGKANSDEQQGSLEQREYIQQVQQSQVNLSAVQDKSVKPIQLEIHPTASSNLQSQQHANVAHFPASHTVPAQASQQPHPQSQRIVVPNAGIAAPQRKSPPKIMIPSGMNYQITGPRISTPLRSPIPGCRTPFVPLQGNVKTTQLVPSNNVYGKGDAGTTPLLRQVQEIQMQRKLQSPCTPVSHQQLVGHIHPGQEHAVQPAILTQTQESSQKTPPQNISVQLTPQRPLNQPSSGQLNCSSGYIPVATQSSMSSRGYSMSPGLSSKQNTELYPRSPGSEVLGPHQGHKTPTSQLSPNFKPGTPGTPLNSIPKTSPDCSPFDLDKHLAKIQLLTKSPGAGFNYASRPMFQPPSPGQEKRTSLQESQGQPSSHPFVQPFFGGGGDAVNKQPVSREGLTSPDSTGKKGGSGQNTFGGGDASLGNMFADGESNMFRIGTSTASLFGDEPSSNGNGSSSSMEFNFSGEGISASGGGMFAMFGGNETSNQESQENQAGFSLSFEGINPNLQGNGFQLF